MPKFLQVTPQYSPYSFEEMLKPLEIYNTAYEKTQEALNKMADEAGALDYIAQGLSDDNPVKQAYLKYSNNLNNTARELMTGLNPDIRSATSSLRNQFSSVIRPLDNAKTTFEKWRDQQTELRARDNSVIFNIDASNPSSGILDLLTKNPAATYAMASGDQAAARVGEQVKGLMNEYRTKLTDGTLPAWVTSKDKQILSSDTSTGLTPEMIEKVRSNPEAYPLINRFIRQAVTSAVDASGVKDWGDQDALNHIINSAWRGVSTGIGKDDTKVVNGPGMNEYQRESLRLEREKFDALKDKNPNPGNGTEKPERKTFYGYITIDNKGVRENYSSYNEYLKSGKGQNPNERSNYKTVNNVGDLYDVYKNLTSNLWNADGTRKAAPGDSASKKEIKRYNDALAVEKQFISNLNSVATIIGGSFNDIYGGTSMDESISESSAFEDAIFGDSISPYLMGLRGSKLELPDDLNLMIDDSGNLALVDMKKQVENPTTDKKETTTVDPNAH